MEPRSFSIFKYCDDDTNLLIRRLTFLAKKRVYEVGEVKEQTEIQVEEEIVTKSKKSKGKTSTAKDGLEKDYGNLHQGLNLNRWLSFADQACSKQPLLAKIENKKSIMVQFELNPKLEALIKVLESSSRSTSKKAKLDNDFSKDMKDTQTILVAVKTPRIATDIQRYLHAKYLRGKNGERTYYEDKLRYHLNSYREYCRRE